MNLSEEVSKGLELFGDSANKQHFTDDSFKKLAQVAFDVLLKKKTEDESLTSDAFGGLDFYILKQAYAALVGLLLEGTKLDADPLLISGTLGERNVSASRTDALAELYGQHKAALRSLLSYTSFNHPHVVDVDWRIDYHIKSANLERIDQLVYHITLKTEVGNGETKDVTFSCSLEELQDLVYRLKDATRQYENHLNRLEKFVK